MSLSLLLAECSDRGWLLNNLFQVTPTLWQANLRSTTHHTGWGRGHTPEAALSAAMDLIELAEPTCVVPTIGAIATPAPSLSQILSRLIPPPAPFTRRRL